MYSLNKTMIYFLFKWIFMIFQSSMDPRKSRCDIPNGGFSIPKHKETKFVPKNSNYISKCKLKDLETI